MLQRLSVEDATHHLGLSQQTIKRRLKKGTLRGEQEGTPTGFRWYVVLDIPDTSADVSTGIPGTSADTTADVPADTPPLMLLARRAEEMAIYSERLLTPVLVRLEAQAEIIGALKERLTAAETEIAELKATPPGTQDAPPAESQAGRSWWQRLVFG